MPDYRSVIFFQGDVGVGEQDELHLIKKLGDLMDATNSKEGNGEQKAPCQSININSPCNNQFVSVSGDYIEVKVHLNDGVEGGREAPDKGASARSEELSVEIQNLVANAVQAISQRHHGRYTPNSRLAPANVREQQLNSH